MIKKIAIIVICALLFVQCSNSQPAKNKLIKIEMHLSAFGVEADDFPSIDAFIFFSNDSSYCISSYYNPAYKGSTYVLSKEELNKIKELLSNAELDKTTKDYSSNRSDQPSSQTIIYTENKKYIFNDYGLDGEPPLKDLYKLVYRY